MSLLIDITKTIKGKSIEKVPNATYLQRLKTCGNCPFLNRSTTSCGTLLKGGTVEHEGKEEKLCGCIVTDKAQYADDNCPLRKW